MGNVRGKSVLVFWSYAFFVFFSFTTIIRQGQLFTKGRVSAKGVCAYSRELLDWEHFCSMPVFLLLYLDEE